MGKKPDVKDKPRRRRATYYRRRYWRTNHQQLFQVTYESQKKSKESWRIHREGVVLSFTIPAENMGDALEAARLEFEKLIGEYTDKLFVLTNAQAL